MRYSFTLRSVVQYFVVLGNSIFLHFRTILNKLKKVASIRYKCYYDHEHCLEDISRNSCININQMEFHYTSCFISSPVAPTKITSSLNFLCNISANTRSYTVRLEGSGKFYGK
ncbi:hypothetical protein T08_14596 [Trichinella sp. T8]|nr:hypothetical protein T08_14596 [Trichinella sp. T8]